MICMKAGKGIMRNSIRTCGRRTGFNVVIAVVFSIYATHGVADTLVGMGDSIGEGVQAGDASWKTQPYSYLNLLSLVMGSEFQLPLILTWPLGAVGETDVRNRFQPAVESPNLAVSGAKVNSLLYEQANALIRQDIDSETDLVLFPRMQSQIEIAESSGADFIICWIGNNDVLSAITSFDQLNASGMTAVADFDRDFTALADRLLASSQTYGSRVVFANIPDVTQVAFLMNGDDLTQFLGSNPGLADGHLTSMFAMLLVRLGLNNGDVMQSPDFILDPAEIVVIQARVNAFNNIIDREAARIGAPVANINGVLQFIAAQPLELFGYTVSRRLLGGFFSLDGLHPSNLGHILLANIFIDTINNAYASGLPRLPAHVINNFLLTEPAMDKDGDNLATGRPQAGLLESLGPALGLTGDPDDLQAEVFAISGAISGAVSGAISADSGSENLPRKTERNSAIGYSGFLNAFRAIYK